MQLNKKNFHGQIISIVKNTFRSFLICGLISLPIAAQSSKGKSIRKAEQWAQQQIYKGEDVDLEGRTIRADFLNNLIKNSVKRNNIPAHGIRISNAEISGDVNLENIEIPYEIRFEKCRFLGQVYFYQTDFKKSLSIQESTFEHSLILSKATIVRNLWATQINIRNNPDVEFPALDFGSLTVGDTLAISNAIFERGTNFYRMKVEGDLFADNTQFNNKDEVVNFDGIKVSGTATFDKTISEGAFGMPNATINQLECVEAQFKKEVNFYNTKIGANTNFNNASFEDEVNFASLDVEKDFEAQGAKFKSNSDLVLFSDTKVGRNIYLSNAVFSGGLAMVKMAIEGKLDFSQASAMSTNPVKNFNGMKADVFIIDNAGLFPPYQMQGVDYHLISGSSEEQIENIVNNSDYSPDVYTNLEAYYRRIGNQEAADDIYIDGKARERDEKYLKGSFLSIPGYLGSWFLYITVGYGKRLSRALIISLIFIFVGCLVFRKEEYMMLQKGEDEEIYKGRYHPIWYSIALFLPIVQLDDTKIWTPKMCRKKSRFYMRLHIILGYLLIPIGLAAWTGLIK